MRARARVRARARPESQGQGQSQGEAYRLALDNGGQSKVMIWFSGSCSSTSALFGDRSFPMKAADCGTNELDS